MEWYQIVITILAAVGGTSGLISIYTAKAKKSTIEIENFKKLFDEAQEERENIRKLHVDYTTETNEKIKSLEHKIEQMDKRNTIKLRAINSAYRCTLPAEIKDCPVLKTLNTECGNEGGLCKN